MALTEKIPLLKTSTIKILIPEINSNIDDNLIKKNLVIEQDKKLRPIIGYCLYDELYTQITTDTLSVANKKLMDDYIVMILSLSVYKRILISTTFQVENNGLRVKLSDSSETASRNDVSFVSQSIDDDINYYTQELIKYICDNQSDYPLYFNCNDGRGHIDRKRAQTGTLGFNISRIGNYGNSTYNETERLY